MAEIPDERLPHTVTLKEPSTTWTTDGNWQTPTYTEHANVKALMIPSSSSVDSTVFGPMPEYEFVMLLKPNQDIGKDWLVVFGSDTFQVVNEPQLFYDPREFPTLSGHHKECLLRRHE